MVNLGTINEDAVARFYFSTAAADGGEENFSATLEEADIPIYKDGTVMTLDASTITITNIATGLYEVDIDTSNDADFTTGSEYWVLLDASDETIDTQAVSGVLGVFRIESASEKAVRLLREYLYPSDSTIATVTSNSTTAINLTDVVDAQTADDELVGLILAVHDATDDRVAHVVTTACTSKVATVELLGDGGAMNFTVAAGDHVWIVGYVDRQYDGTNLTEAGGTGDQLTAVPWNASWDAEVESEVVDALGLITGTAQTGTLSTTVATTDLTGYADDELIGRVIKFKSGTAAGQAAVITDYANASGTVTYTTLATAPANNDTFVII